MKRIIRYKGNNYVWFKLSHVWFKKISWHKGDENLWNEVLLLSIIKNSLFKIGAYKIVIVCKINRAYFPSIL